MRLQEFDHASSWNHFVHFQLALTENPMISRGRSPKDSIQLLLLLTLTLFHILEPIVVQPMKNIALLCSKGKSQPLQIQQNFSTRQPLIHSAAL